MKGSWKTTASAIAGILVTVLSLVIIPLTDGDDKTKPRFDEAIAIIIASTSGLFARDDDKTSEQVGAK